MTFLCIALVWLTGFGLARFLFPSPARWSLHSVFLFSLGTGLGMGIASGLYLFLGVTSWDLYPYLLPVFGYFVFGVFSGHAVYLPELFPTQVRATAVSFCNGTGRVITSRPIDRRPYHADARRAGQHRHRDHDLLRRPEHHRDDIWPGNPR